MVSTESPKRFSKLCVNCGKDIPLSRDTCPFCGAEQGQKPTTPQSLPPPPSSEPEVPLNLPSQPNVGASGLNPNMMYCQTCGTQIAKTALACPKCGAPTGQPKPKETETPIYGIMSLAFVVIGIFVAGLICGIIGVILGAMSITHHKSTSGIALGVIGVIFGLLETLFMAALLFA